MYALPHFLKKEMRMDIIRRMEQKTFHASLRQQQRAISDFEIKQVILWGDCYRQSGGRRAFFLGRRAVKKAAQFGHKLDAFKNLAVVVGPDHVILTVLRTNSPKRIKRYSKSHTYHLEAEPPLWVAWKDKQKLPQNNESLLMLNPPNPHQDPSQDS